MADVKLTAKTALTTPATGDFFHVVDVSDTTSSPAGSSKKITYGNLTSNLTGTASNLTAGNVTTNANLTGEVTSSGNAAILNSTAISNKTEVAAVSGDMVLIEDATDGSLKKADAGDFLVGVSQPFEQLPLDVSGATTTYKSLVGGGLMYNYSYAGTGLTTAASTSFPQTITLSPGEALDELQFVVKTYTSDVVVKVGLYANEERTVSGNTCYGPAAKLAEITTGLTVTSTGTKTISSIAFTAAAGETEKGIYWVVLFTDSAGIVLERLNSSNLIPNIGGGNMAGNIFYRSYMQQLTGYVSDLPTTLSPLQPTSATAPGLFITYKKG